MLQGFAPSIFFSSNLRSEIGLFFFFWWLINHCVILHKLPLQLTSTEDLMNAQWEARKCVSLSVLSNRWDQTFFLSFPFTDSVARPVSHCEGQSSVCWSEEELPVHGVCGLMCVFLCTSSWELSWELAYTSFIWSTWNQSTWETRWTVNKV